MVEATIDPAEIIALNTKLSGLVNRIEAHHAVPEETLQLLRASLIHIAFAHLYATPTAPSKDETRALRVIVGAMWLHLHPNTCPRCGVSNVEQVGTTYRCRNCSHGYDPNQTVGTITRYDVVLATGGRPFCAVDEQQAQAWADAWNEGCGKDSPNACRVEQVTYIRGLTV